MENIQFEKLNKTPVRTLNSLRINDIDVKDFTMPKIGKFNNVKIINENESGVEVFVHTIESGIFTYGVDSELLNQAINNYNQGYNIKILKTLSKPVFIEFNLDDINSYDASLMEKVKTIEELNADEKKMVFAFVDALVGKKKLKDALSNVLHDVK